MSDVLVTYKSQNKFEKYFVLPTEEQKTIDSLTTNFIQELVTEKGTCIFDREYGSNFLKEVGEQVNIYKIQHILENSISEIKEKYGIASVDVSDAIFNQSDGFLEIRLSIEYSDVSLEKHFNFMYSGTFTDKLIVEID
jgi:hypothetical protein